MARTINFFLLCHKIKKTDAKAYFLANCGSVAFNFIKSELSHLKLTDTSVVFQEVNDQKKISIRATIEKALKPKVIFHYEQYKLTCCRQKGRPIHDFVNELRKLANTYKYGTLLDDILLR